MPVKIEPITDLVRYNLEMSKSMIDKIYFLDKVDANMVVDFGCANGVMLRFIEKMFPGIVLVGYDNDEKMIASAKAESQDSSILFTSDWQDVVDAVAAYKASAPSGQNKVCLVLSSVLHEVESYLQEDAKADVYRKVWGEDGVVFEYVANRDMMARKSTSRLADPTQVERIRQVFGHDHPEKLDAWESRWGNLQEGWSLTHFLLSYRYLHNWEREYRENYLPRNYEDFIAAVPRNYKTIYTNHYTLPFLRRRVEEDFDIALTDFTHIQVVFERKRD
jgi:SAM-dependent methyltransferase